MAKSVNSLAGLSELASLGAQISEDKPEKELLSIPVDQIDSLAQPRTVFNNIDELAASLKEIGQQQPIVVNALNGRYVIEQGERRWRAAKEAGLTHLLCLVVERGEKESDIVIRQLSENIQREAMTLGDLSKSISELVKSGLSIRELAKRLGKKESWISTLNAVADLPDELELLVEKRRIQDPQALRKLQKLFEKYPKEVAKQVRRWAKVTPPEPGEEDDGPDVVSRPLVQAFAKKLEIASRKADAAEEKLQHVETSEEDAEEADRDEKPYALPKGCELKDADSLRVAVMYRNQPGYLCTSVLPPKKKLCIVLRSGDYLAVPADEVELVGISKAN